ncbi:MAG TPA: MmgE/PrpD family protein [Burkholderiaceae bacterium]|jgi:2-methylcitrate dehydratase PrpD
MDQPTIARQLAQFICTTSFDALPPEVVEQAKSRVLDSLGTAFASRKLPVPGVALKFTAGNQGEATVFGHARRLPAVDAALVNATLINGTTHDDFVGKAHPGAVTLPAAMAIAEQAGRGGRELLTGLVLGYDLVARAYLGGPAMLPKFRATGVAGAVGAAASAGSLLGLEVDAMTSALGLSTMFASGFGEGFVSGTMDVKLNVGWASRSGVSAALMAHCGATASPSAFEGKSGFFMAFAGTVEHASRAVADLGRPFLITETVYKERPVCIFVQTPVGLALRLAREHAIDPAKIERVVIHAPEATFTNPGYRNVAPFISQLQARISARFTVAAALLGRPVDEYDYYYNTGDAEVLALAERIDLADPTDDTQNIRLDVAFAGQQVSASAFEMDALRPSLEKSVAKFRRLTASLLGAKADEIVRTVLALETVRNIRDLTDQLRLSDKVEAEALS